MKISNVGFRISNLFIADALRRRFWLAPRFIASVVAQPPTAG